MLYKAPDGLFDQHVEIVKYLSYTNEKLNIKQNMEFNVNKCVKIGR